MHTKDTHFLQSIMCYYSKPLEWTCRRENWFLRASDLREVQLCSANTCIMRDAVLLLCPLQRQKVFLKYGQRSKKHFFNFTTGHLRHTLGKHRAVRAVKAVHAHNLSNAMHQYVKRNLSLRDTIRRRREQPVIGWRERADWQLRKSKAVLKISSVRKTGTLLCHLSRALTPGFSYPGQKDK